MNKNNRVNIVMYHYVRNLMRSRYPSIRGLESKNFKEQIAFFKANFNIITMEELLAAYSESYDLPENALLLTFDDGYIDHFTEVFPILKNQKIQGSFFPVMSTMEEYTLLDVNKVHFILATTHIELLMQDLKEVYDEYKKMYNLTDYNELYNQYAIASRFDTADVVFFKRMLQVILPEHIRTEISSRIFKKRIGISEEVFAREIYLTPDQMKCMKQSGMYFGLHGYGHYWLGDIVKEDMKNDIDKALDAMEGLIDRKKWVMNYPYGSYNDETISYIKERGCELALTTEVRVLDITKDDRFRVPRLDTNDFPPKSNQYIELNRGESYE